MTPGAVYYVTWIAGNHDAVKHELLRFETEHPSGMLIFTYADGFASVPIRRGDLMGYQLAEATR